MATATQHHSVRVDDKTYCALREIAKERGESMAAVVTRAIKRYEREMFWEAANAEIAAIRADPVAWAELQAEDRIWEATLMDGLEDEESW